MGRVSHRQARPHRWSRETLCPVRGKPAEQGRFAYRHLPTRAHRFAPLNADGALLVPELRPARRWPALSDAVRPTTSALAIAVAGRFTATADALYALLLVAGSILLVCPRYTAPLAGCIPLVYPLPLLAALQAPVVRPGGEAFQTAGTHPLAFLGPGRVLTCLSTDSRWRPVCARSC